MTNYALIFGGAVVLNLSLTVRSSDYYKEYVRRKQHSRNRRLLKTSSRSLSLSVSYHGTNNEQHGGEDDFSKTTTNDTSSKQDLLKWKKLRRQYLSVYLCATLADWLQGPYVYALYAQYGYTQHEIAILFVAAFASSMILGSLVAAMADWAGRRAFIILFATVYASSCLTKHFNHFGILLAGRLLGGVATSLLFSVFEAWWIRAHTDAGLRAYLGKSFSWAAYGNSIVAILAGLIANKAASIGQTAPLIATDSASNSMLGQHVYVGGFVNPFDIAILSLVVCGVRAATTWEENYGGNIGCADNASDDDDSNNKQTAATWHMGIQTAVQTIVRSTDILLCGLISSLFEGSMYIFVFMWTPALTEREDIQLPFGLIFSTFMVCCMAGSSAYSILLCSNNNDSSSNNSGPPLRGEQVAVGLFAIAAGSMLVIALATQTTVKFIAMNLFEFCVGVYWPVMGTLKGSIVPESMRAAIYGIFRVPLNLIVLSSLMTDLTPTQSFALNFYMLGTACVLMVVLMKRRELHQGAGTMSSSSPSSTGTSRTASPSSLSSAATTATTNKTTSGTAKTTRTRTTKRTASTIRRANSEHSSSDHDRPVNSGAGLRELHQSGTDDPTAPLVAGAESV